jgi:glyoxylase-like metal-dependent hydrolase (beta-lactamase superfamily II)
VNLSRRPTGTPRVVGQRTRRLTEHVSRMRIDSACGLVVTVYVLQREGHVALVDTGFPYTTHQLEQGLAELGLSVEDVDDVLYTHAHIDHVGGGVALDDRWEARAWFWKGCAPAFGDLYGYLDGIRTSSTWPQDVLPEHARQLPAAAEISSKPRLTWRSGGTGHISRVQGAAFGEVVSIGPWRMQCLDARGHGPFHCGWRDVEHNWLFSGDVVLSVPTPISRAMGDDMLQWLGTLRRWSTTLDCCWMLPGHGTPTRLFEASIARSRANADRLVVAASECLGSGRLVDPSTLTTALLPQDSSRYAARSSVLLCNAHAVLESWCDSGWVRREGGREYSAVNLTPRSCDDWLDRCEIF